MQREGIAVVKGIITRHLIKFYIRQIRIILLAKRSKLTSGSALPGEFFKTVITILIQLNYPVIGCHIGRASFVLIHHKIVKSENIGIIKYM
ncbi:hypothetical protein BG74_00605 [Sodalis-like endosymbiont of Proechinophthirus fluctus]|nr:hypothetical protein BG74_00605 [Sodalis-like endosymbiont of Proechinophthirus fluctus]